MVQDNKGRKTGRERIHTFLKFLTKIPTVAQTSNATLPTHLYGNHSAVCCFESVLVVGVGGGAVAVGLVL